MHDTLPDPGRCGLEHKIMWIDKSKAFIEICRGLTGQDLMP